MTDLRKIVKRRTVDQHYMGRRLTVMLMPGDVIGFREERRRRVYTAPLAKVFMSVVRWNVEADRAAKKAARKARRAG